MDSGKRRIIRKTNEKDKRKCIQRNSIYYLITKKVQGDISTLQTNILFNVIDLKGELVFIREE